jgi:RimJ/RimL family protein N-acetyltransferase
MFGVNMIVRHNGQVVCLRPFSKNDIPELVKHFSSMEVNQYTQMLFAATEEGEEHWYEEKRTDKDSCVWAIQPEGSDVAIGVTELGNITSRVNSSSSGIVIWDKSWWGKGVASAAHLGRTLFAADYLNRFTIRSSVRVPNIASRKALERIGYTVWGTEPLVVCRGGVWLDTLQLIWIHPDRVSVFSPDVVPEMYKAGIENAKVALNTARTEVEFP